MRPSGVITVSVGMMTHARAQVLRQMAMLSSIRLVFTVRTMDDMMLDVTRAVPNKRTRSVCLFGSMTSPLSDRGDRMGPKLSERLIGLSVWSGRASCVGI